MKFCFIIHAGGLSARVIAGIAVGGSLFILFAIAIIIIIIIIIIIYIMKEKKKSYKP